MPLDLLLKFGCTVVFGKWVVVWVVQSVHAVIWCFVVLTDSSTTVSVVSYICLFIELCTCMNVHVCVFRCSSVCICVFLLIPLRNQTASTFVVLTSLEGLARVMQCSHYSVFVVCSASREPSSTKPKVPLYLALSRISVCGFYSYRDWNVLRVIQKKQWLLDFPLL